MSLALLMVPGWEEDIFLATDKFFAERLGPDIHADAWRLCPVFGGANSTAKPSSIAAAGADYEPGALRDSLEYHLAGHDLVVSATGSDERWYAAYVEMGHRIVAWGHATGGFKGPQPFLRMALYAKRAY